MRTPAMQRDLDDDVGAHLAGSRKADRDRAVPIRISRDLGGHADTPDADTPYAVVTHGHRVLSMAIRSA